VSITSTKDLQSAGFRLGDRGTHTSRTMMLQEVSELLAAVPHGTRRAGYAEAIVSGNVLGKETAANRRLTNQRLGELYGLDPLVPLFRVLLRVWEADPEGRPVSAVLCALARDPLFRATAPAVLSLEPGEELLRTSLTGAIADATVGRLNESTLDKVARNAASSWNQSGHLEGRVRKIRRRVQPTPGPTALALWLGSVEGKAGEDLLRTSWAKVLDAPPGALLELTLRAKQLGLIRARSGGGVVEIDARSLDPAEGRR
jgi:hypothetical protein